ncbi:MAG: helix-turn-helix transcriptional regulator [Rhodospirillaceae bacterium]|nr:helix-turn-helix transcriptional regulator [Rhodospirillales bacterium]
MAQDVDKSDVMRAIGARLRLTRKALGLSQDDLADSINVGRTTYTMWEGGQRLADVLAISRMADRYGVSLDWVYRGNMAGLPHVIARRIEELRAS